MKNIFIWMKDETIQIIPAIIYFLIAFHLIYYTVGLTLEKGEIRYFNSLSVTLSALLVGKLLIIVNAFPFFKTLLRQPLIYNIIWKLFIYILCLFLLWSLDTFLHLYFHFDNIDVVLQHFKIDFHSPRFWSTFLWLTYAFFIFVVASEFTRVLGKKNILKMLFEKPK